MLPSCAAMCCAALGAASVIQFSSDSYEVSEAAGQIGITVSIYPPPSTRTGFLMKAIGGTADPASDYGLPGNFLYIPPGSTNVLIPVYVADDCIPESDETVLLSLSDPQPPAQLGARSHAILTIHDGPPRLRVINIPPVPENSPLRVILRRCGETNVAVGVDYRTSTNGTARAGVDYLPRSGRFEFLPGEIEKEFQITNVLDNAEVDAPGTKNLEVVLSNVSSGATLEVTNLLFSIVDNEINGSNDPDFYPAVAAHVRPWLGGYFVAPAGGLKPNEPQKLWISGGSEGVARLNEDGSLDSTFQATRSSDWLDPLTAMRDGSLLAVEAWSRNFGEVATNRLVRLLPNGNKDSSFVRSSNVVFAVEQPDGKIVLVSEAAYVAFEAPVFSNVVSRITRILPDGTLDGSFQSSEISTTNSFNYYGHIVTALRVDARNRILVAGSFDHHNNAETSCLIRLNPDGSADPSFQPRLKRADGSPAHAYNLLLDAAGRLVVLGDFGAGDPSTDYFESKILRLHEDGTLDQTFHPDAAANDVIAFAAESDGGLLMAKYSQLVQRLNPDGSLDANFQTGGEIRGLLCSGTLERDDRPALAVDGLGRILRAGWPCAICQPYNGQVLPGLVRLQRSERNRQQFQASYPVCNSLPSPGFSESNTVARVRVFRTGETSQHASVQVLTLDDTALTGRDYASYSGQIDFAPLEVEKEISIPIFDNKVLDGDRQFRVALLNPSAGYSVPSVPRPFVILDDEPGFPPGALRFTAEGTLRITFLNPPCGNVALQSSLDAQHWSVAQTVNTCDRTLAFEPPGARLDAHRFFRVVSLP